MHANAHAIAHAMKAGKLQTHEADAIIEPGNVLCSPLQGNRHGVVDTEEETQI
jgi:hypothetical protein